ncbi:MAG: nuclear transport factor 2 family protein [Pseudomonadota bacterium]
MSISAETLVDRALISDVIYSYCQGVDRQNWAQVEDCFTPDAQHDHGSFIGDTDTFIGFASAVLQQMAGTLHHIGNIRIDISGNTATSEASFVAYHRIRANSDGPLDTEAADIDWIVAGQYRDSWLKTGVGWRIKERQAIHDWTRRELANT